MTSSITAVLVVKNGGSALTETLDALDAQTLKPSRIITISIGKNEALLQQIAERTSSRVIVTKPKTTFGEALAFGVKATEPLTQDGAEWLWFLTEDSAPEANALEELVQTIARTGSATVAGPKLVGWDDPRQIIELGQGLTWSGARWGLDNQELDQQQYDHQEDVLGVGPVGMLVRRDVWERLDGFDQALPVYDDGLDFSVRARLAGYRVIVVPQARLRFDRTGVAGPKINRKQSVLRTAHRNARTAALHRRLAYARAPFVPFLWLALPIIGVLGMLWALVRGRPGTMIGELVAALGVFLHPGRIVRARGKISKQRTAKWGALKTLRTDRKTVRSVKAVRKEAILAEQGRGRRDLHFISTGGLGLTIGMSVLAVALTWWVLGASFLNGGGAGPLGSFKQIWANTVGSNPAGLGDLAAFGEAVPADPMNWVLAIFGSLTFWNPSFAVVLLIIFAVPLAALGGWMWGAKLSESTSARVLSGLLWGAGPMLLAALSTGRINSVILAVILPWALLAIANAHVTWSWAATASLLVAGTLAAAPSLLPAAVILLIAALIMKPKKIAQTLLIGLAPAVLFAPIILRAWMRGQPLDALIDPGFLQPYTPATPWQMLLGFPTFGLDGWGDILTSAGLTGLSLTLTIGLALIPLALLALLGLFVGHPRVTSLAALAGALGLVTALLSPYFLLVPNGNEMVAVWAGSGLALYWAAITTLAVVGAPKLARAAAPVVALTIVGTLIVVAPSLVKLATNDVAITPNVQQLPAVALAKSQTDPTIKTVFLTALDAHEMRIEIIEGPAKTLDQQRTALANAPVASEEEAIAELIGQLASSGNQDLSEQLRDHRINAIVLRPAANSKGLGLHSQIQTAFDQQNSLEAVGETSKGMLWRSNVEIGAAPTMQSTEERLVWGVQIGVLIGIILLALPMSEVRQAPPRKQRRKRGTAAASSVPVTTPASFGPPAVAEMPADVAGSAGAEIPADAERVDGEDHERAE